MHAALAGKTHNLTIFGNATKKNKQREPYQKRKHVIAVTSYCVYSAVLLKMTKFLLKERWSRNIH